MRLLSLVILLPLLLSVRGPGSQEASARAAPGPVRKAPSKAEDKVVPAEVRLADESVVKVGVLQENLSVVTRYGKLTVPAREVRRIAFGRRYPEGVARRIDAAIVRLGGRDFKDRELASAELLARGELAYPALVRALKSSDLETAKRAQTLVDTLQAKLSEERLRTPAHDVIETEAFTIIGHIEGPTLKVSTAYFGEVPLRLIDLRSWRSTNADRGTTTVVVDAAKYAGPVQSWMETNVEVSADTELKISAKGRVDLYPLAGSVGMYLATPAGSVGAGAVRFAIVPQVSPGALVGRVGRSGKVFLIGEDYKGKPGEEGRLYLSIMPSAWNNASSGEYTVTIRANAGR